MIGNIVNNTNQDVVSIAVIDGKQWYNGDEYVIIELMYTFNAVLYFDATNCNNYYYIGIQQVDIDEAVVFIGISVDANYRVIASLDSYYSLRIELTNTMNWNISINNQIYFASDLIFNRINAN